MSAPAGNTVTGTLIMPFGLALDAGVTFEIDDKPAMQPVRFRTCLPGGCLVNVSFDAVPEQLHPRSPALPFRHLLPGAFALALSFTAGKQRHYAARTASGWAHPSIRCYRKTDVPVYRYGVRLCCPGAPA
ncbi:invasion associated locus B family protein [Phyllobacterium phragmitis]|nr:invasion associated locus B family protein [Phyllobacterium phragmitis]